MNEAEFTFTCSYEEIDRMVLQRLKEIQNGYIADLLDAQNGGWMHPDDVADAKYKYLPALHVLINYFTE